MSDEAKEIERLAIHSHSIKQPVKDCGWCDLAALARRLHGEWEAAEPSMSESKQEATRDEDFCERCKCCSLEWETCNECGGDGYVDCCEDDPINYTPGDEHEQCDECGGKGGWSLCVGECDKNGTHTVRQ